MVWTGKTIMCSVVRRRCFYTRAILRTLNDSSRAQFATRIHVQCFAHTRSLIIVETWGSCTETRNSFGYIQSKSLWQHVKVKHYLWNTRLKCFTQMTVLVKWNTFLRWKSHHRVIDVVFEKYNVVSNTLEDPSNISDPSL